MKRLICRVCPSTASDNVAIFKATNTNLKGEEQIIVLCQSCYDEMAEEMIQDGWKFEQFGFKVVEPTENVQ